MGDVIHTWPLVVALRRAVPDSEIAWLVEEPLLPLVSGHPDVATAIPVATRRWRKAPLSAATRQAIRSARAQVRAFAPSVAIDPQGLVKSAVWARLAGVPCRIGFSARVRRERLAGAFYTATVTPDDHWRHVVDLNLALLTALGVEPAYGASPDASFLRGSGARPRTAENDTVALLPGAGTAGKRWGSQQYGELAKRLAASGLRPLVVWGPGEEVLARRIAADSGDAAEVAPPTTLPELCRLLADCRAAVGGDTGPVHLAAALGIPTVAIHVTTDADRNGARGPRVNVLTGSRPGRVGSGARTSRARAVAVGDVHASLTGLLEAGR